MNKYDGIMLAHFALKLSSDNTPQKNSRNKKRNYLSLGANVNKKVCEIPRFAQLIAARFKSGSYSCRHVLDKMNWGRLPDRNEVNMSDARIKIRKQIEELDTLPPLPEAARQIMELRNHPRPDSTALAKIVEMDPSLSAQVIRYARSSLYGYRGNVDSAEAAISRVLGYEMVMNLALGLATAAPFNIPRLGPLGSDAYWRRALQSAVVCQNLAGVVRDKSIILPSMAYLAGLLHDFGLLVLGHLFPDEYKRLNEEVLDDPSLDISRRENEIMGVTHAEAGARALRYWDLPDELVVAALKHSDLHYQGLHEEYPHIIVVARVMLSEDGRDDLEAALQISSQEPWFKEMGLSVVGLINSAEKVLKNIDEMEGIVSRAA